MRRDALRGRKSKAGGGKKSKATREYTPLQIHENNAVCVSSFNLTVQKEAVDITGKIARVDGKQSKPLSIHLNHVSWS